MNLLLFRVEEEESESRGGAVSVSVEGFFFRLFLDFRFADEDWALAVVSNPGVETLMSIKEKRRYLEPFIKSENGRLTMLEKRIPNLFHQGFCSAL